MTSELPKLKNFEQFLFELPLYAPHALTEDFGPEQLFGWQQRHEPDVILDGHCPYCNRQSTFSIQYAWIASGTAREPDKIASSVAHHDMSITCSRSRMHSIHYKFRMKRLVVQKIGQYPSLADIANDEVSAYRKDMDKVDAQEFHKAIGLAAHGVGVGSFVYLRRVFERLIGKRFQEFKDAEGWDENDFRTMPMEDKVGLLSGHLPQFLVENRKIYSVLSIGIHELDEKACLDAFEAMKQSIIIILEDDKTKKDELARRIQLSKAIGRFSAKGGSD